MIAYDDPTSFAAKGRFIKDLGLAGFAMYVSTGRLPHIQVLDATDGYYCRWEAGADYETVLLDAILSTAA